MQEKKTLHRRKSDRYLTGLAGGLADYFNLDASLVRIMLILLEIFTAGLLIFVYLIVSIFVPKQSR